MHAHAFLWTVSARWKPTQIQIHAIIQTVRPSACPSYCGWPLIHHDFSQWIFYQNNWNYSNCWQSFQLYCDHSTTTSYKYHKSDDMYIMLVSNSVKHKSVSYRALKSNSLLTELICLLPQRRTSYLLGRAVLLLPERKCDTLSWLFIWFFYWQETDQSLCTYSHILELHFKCTAFLMYYYYNDFLVFLLILICEYLFLFGNSNSNTMNCFLFYCI